MNPTHGVAISGGAIRRVSLTGMLAAFAYVVLLVLFAAYADPVYTAWQRFLAWVVFVMGTVPIMRFLRRPVGVPLIQFVLLQYAVLFAIPVFYENHVAGYLYVGVPGEDAISMTLVCGILALVSLQIGYRFAERHVRIRPSLLSFPASDTRLFAVACLLSAGAAVLYGTVDIPENARETVRIAVSSDLAVAVLGLLHFQGRLTRVQSATAYALLVVTVLVGLASGMTQAALQPILIWMTCKWLVQRRVPTRAAVAMVIVFFALHPVKSAFRRQVWESGKAFTVPERLVIYRGLILDHWAHPRDRATGVGDEVRLAATERLTLLLTTAHYIESTPRDVPYKYGQTLSYALYSWIPRLLWPGKPIAQLANKVMPVEYGLQSPQSTQTTMVGVGHVAEAYVNFGILGIVPLFVTLGLIYYIPVAYLRRAQTVPALAIVIALTVGIMWIGSTIGDSFVSIPQQLVVQGILLRAITGYAGRSKRDVA